MDHDRRAFRNQDQFFSNAKMRFQSFFMLMTPTIFLHLILECLRGKSPPIGNAEQ